MNPEIQIVFVEDVPRDAELVKQALSRSGLAFQLHRVDTREAFLRELELHPPDVILSDHGLPSFDGFAALALAREKRPRTPFIFVTNALTKEMEIEKLAPGVTDFVSKSRLGELVPIIRHALYQMEVLWQESSRRGELDGIVRRVQALLAEYKAKGGCIPICSNCKKIRDGKNLWQSPEYFFRKHLNLNFTHGICPDCFREYSR